MSLIANICNYGVTNIVISYECFIYSYVCVQKSSQIEAKILPEAMLPLTLSFSGTILLLKLLASVSQVSLVQNLNPHITG